MSEIVLYTNELILEQSATEPGADAITTQPAELSFIERGQEVAANSPEAFLLGAIGVAYAVGAALEYRALSREEKKRQALVDVYGDVTEEIHPSGKRNTFRKIRTAAVSLGALGGGLVGAANAAPFVSDEPKVSEPASIEVVVDKSGDTLRNNQAAAIDIQTILSASTELDDVELVARNATVDGVETTSMEDSAALTPFGEAPIQDALNISIDRIETDRADLQVGESVRNSAIVVLTNGNGDFSLSTQREVEELNAPVYIFDVDDDSPAQDDLMNIAGDNYVSASGITRDEALEQMSAIESDLEEASREAQTDKNWMPSILVAGLSLFAATKWRIERNRRTTNFSFGGRRSTREFMSDTMQQFNNWRADRMGRRAVKKATMHSNEGEQ